MASGVLVTFCRSERSVDDAKEGHKATMKEVSNMSNYTLLA